MTDELKNKIRRERIIETIYNTKNKLIYNRNIFYNSAIPKVDAYYKSPNQFSLKDITEDDIIDSKNKKLKKDCIDFLYTIGNIKIDDKLIEDFKEMNIDEVLLKTYRNFLEYQIFSVAEPVDYIAFNNMTLDALEEMLDKIIARKEKISKDKEKYKSWWNIF